MIQRIYLLLILAVTLGITLPGCLSVKSHRDADPYAIHHHTWWNYYERGRLYLKDQKFEESQHDFETALGRRPGARTSYDQDRWKVRTYGVHMLEGYFPHRELGICLFEQKHYTEALELLEKSMEMEPSARAKFYINRLREQVARSTAPPKIEPIILPEWTTQHHHVVSGSVVGVNQIVQFSINDDPEFIELATPRIHFERELALQEGRNQIAITAQDITGKQVSTNLTLMADWTPPEIQLNHSGQMLNISCRDNLELQQLQLNERVIDLAGKEHLQTCPLDPNTPLQIVATDRAGNRMEWNLTKKELSHLSQNKMPAPPIFHLSDAGKTITLYNPQYALDLRVEDDSALQSVTLNGINLLARDSPLFRCMHYIPLEAGTNQLMLAATDFDGNTTEEQITVIYRLPEYLDRMYRLATSLSPIAGEITDPALGHRINHLINRELTREPIRFYLLASDADLQHLQKEQTLSDSKFSDSRAQLKNNKQLDPDLTFISRMLNDGAGHTIYTQVLDSNSNEELFIEDIYLEDLRLLPKQLSGLVMKIEQRFPLIQARIEKQDNRLVATAGENKGAQKGMRFLVVRSDSGFEQGRVLKAGKRPAELVLSKVASDRSRVIIAYEESKNPAQPGDYIFSR